MRTTIIVLATALAVAVPLAAQDEPRFEEKVDVSLVQLDVTVTDKKGNQILGLDKTDFIVTENGQRVAVDSMDYFTNRRLLDSPESRAAFKVEQVREERYFVIMFHTINDAEARSVMQREIQQARRGATDFVRTRIKEQDRVAIVGHDFRLKIYSDFTSDPDALVRAIDEAVTFSNGIIETPASPVANGILANIDMHEVINRTGRVYDSIRILADALDPIPARKVLVLFSPGIGEPSQFSAQIPENDRVWFDPMMEAVQKANVTVYPMHLLPRAPLHAGESNLVIMANDTGGEYYRQATSFEMPLKIIENQNNGYYMLSYYAQPADTKPVSIDVKLANPEFVVKARKAR